MEILFHKSFKKELKKCSQKVQKAFDEKFLIFIQDPFSQALNNHALTGEYQGVRSINITGDVRALYTIENDVVVFIKLGTHSQLY